MSSDSLRCKTCQQVVDYFGDRLLHVYPGPHDHPAAIDALEKP